MADVHRHRWGNINPKDMAVASATVIEIGDLLWYDVANNQVKNMASLVFTDLANGQLRSHFLFAGIAMSASASLATADIKVGTAGVWELPCASASFGQNDLVGIDDNAGPTAYVDQQVIAAGDEMLSIGRVAAVAATVTTVLVEINPRIVRGGWGSAGAITISQTCATDGTTTYIIFPTASSAEGAPFKFRVMDAWILKTHANGGAGDKLELLNVANLIGDVDGNINDKAVGRIDDIDDAYHDVAESTLFSIKWTKATSSQGIAYITIKPIA